MYLYLKYLIFFVFLFSYSIQAEIKGKVDAGPTYLVVDLLESGKTVKTLKMIGFKSDATLLIYKGFCVKPSILMGWGNGEVASFSLGAGCYLPLTKQLKILPNAGVIWSSLHTHVDFEPMGLFHLKERFRSTSPFIGLEICYALNSKLTLMAIYQYAWCRTHTKIGSLISQTSHSYGPNYSVGVDYSLTDYLSIQLGVGYNITLSHEKHGIRGKGAKLGLAYYF